MDLKNEFAAFLSYREKLNALITNISWRNQSHKNENNVAGRIKSSNIMKYTNFFNGNYVCDVDAEIINQASEVYFNYEKRFNMTDYTTELMEMVPMSLEYETLIKSIETDIETEEIECIKSRKRKFGLFPKFELSVKTIKKIKGLQMKILDDADCIVTRYHAKIVRNKKVIEVE